MGNTYVMDSGYGRWNAVCALVLIRTGKGFYCDAWPKGLRSRSGHVTQALWVPVLVFAGGGCSRPNTTGKLLVTEPLLSPVTAAPSVLRQGSWPVGHLSPEEFLVCYQIWPWALIWLGYKGSPAGGRFESSLEQHICNTRSSPWQGTPTMATPQDSALTLMRKRIRVTDPPLKP